MEKIDFNNLEYDLYELLNLEQSCSVDDVKKKFRQVVKKFHPDKISKLEEKIYYNITIAHHVLSNEKTKRDYDNWVNNKNSHFDLKNNFKTSNDSIKDYFPQTKKEASVGFARDSKYLRNRHGNFVEDSRSFNILINDKKQQRSKSYNITRENFRNIDEFNNSFTDKKQNGEFSDKIIKYENDKIVAYDRTKSIC